MAREKGATITIQQVVDLPWRVAGGRLRFRPDGSLCNFDGERGYSL